MSNAGMPRWSLRLERAETSRLAWAFAISLACHLLIFGTYQTGKKYHLWQNLHWPTWLQPPKMLADLLKKKPNPPPPPQRQDIPLIFVNVNPAQATAEPPKNARYYSDKNARAANPEASKTTETPKITGEQTEVVKTEDISREKFTPLQPARPAQQPQEAQPEVKPKPTYTPGDLTLAKPSPTPRQTEGEAAEAKPPRPRTIKEALARLHESQLPGEKMREEGGEPPRRNGLAGHPGHAIRRLRCGID